MSRSMNERDLLDDDDAPRPWPRWLKLLLAALPLVAAAVLGMRWLDDTSARDQVQVLQSLPQSDADKTATTSAMTYPFSEASGAQGSSAAAPAATDASAARATPSAALRVPPGLSAEQWRAIVAELSGKPGGDAEIARLDAYYRFSDQVRQFRQLQNTATSQPSPSLVALAKQLDAKLDAHVQRRELTGSEAYDIKAAVLEIIEPDADAADDKLERWAESHIVTTTDTDRAAMARDAEYERRRTALVNAWQALPVDQRDPKALERDIIRLRQEIYGTLGR